VLRRRLRNTSARLLKVNSTYVPSLCHIVVVVPSWTAVNWLMATKVIAVRVLPLVNDIPLFEPIVT